MKGNSNLKGGEGPVVKMDAGDPSASSAGDSAVPGGVSEPGTAESLSPGWWMWGRGVVTILELTIRQARRLAGPNQFEAATAGAAIVGRLAVVASQVLAILVGVVAAIKLEEPRYAWVGAVNALWLAVMLFAADKFLGAGLGLIRALPSRLRAWALLDWVALAAFLGGWSVFGTRAMTGQAVEYIIGIAAAAFGIGLAWVSLHPGLVNVQRDDQLGPGEEAMGILSFLMKAGVRMVPFAFGAGTLAAAAALVSALVPLLRQDRILPAVRAMAFASFSASLPLVGYVAFVFYYLVVELVRAILSIPSRLDAPKGDRAA